MSIQINGWAEPDQTWVGLRNTEEEYAKKFVDLGQIKFSTPQSWVDYAKKNIGRGDPFEGMVACAPTCDIARIRELRTKYPGSREDNYEETVIFRREEDMNLPCFCYYSIKNNLFPCPKTTGEHTVSAHIPAEYFKSFDDKKPAIVTFRVSEFQRMLKNFLFSHGLSKEELQIYHIKYFEYSKGMWIDTNTNPPSELFCKTSHFRIQEEDRIVINTTNAKLLKLLEKPIEIGSMQKGDIAKYWGEGQKEKEHGLDVSMVVNMTTDPFRAYGITDHSS